MTDSRSLAPRADLPAGSLLATHEPSQVRHWLEQLDALVHHMDRDGWDAWARDRARAVIEFFSGAVRRLRADEEGTLFPLLAHREEQVDRLLQDLGWMDENWTELVSQLRPIAEGFGGTDVDMLRHATQVYSALWDEHLELVQHLLPGASHGLGVTAADRAGLAA